MANGTGEAFKIELIEWRDANFDKDGDWDDVNDDFICATIGWTKDTERWVVIVSEITPGGERSITRVPQENVITRKRLVVKEDEETKNTNPLKRQIKNPPGLN